MKIFLKVLHFIILLICLVLQVSFFENLRSSFISMDLVMVCLLGITVFDGEVIGLVYAFAAGFILDLMTGMVIGVSPLLYALTVFIAARFFSLGFKKRLPLNILIIFLLTEINLMALTGVYYLFHFKASPSALGIELLVNPVGNILAMFMLFPLLNLGREKKEELGFAYKDEN